MFSRQAPLIGESLFLSGMAPPLASAIQNLTGQCRAPIVHRGPVTLDYTRPDMRLITPDIARHGYPDLSLPTPEPFPKKPKKEQPEDPDPPVVDRFTPFTPPEHFPGDQPVGAGGGDGQYFAGDYIRIDEPRREIHLNHSDERRHCVFPGGMNALDKVHSVDFRGVTNSPKYFQFLIQDRPRDTLFILNIKHLEEVNVVTDVYMNETNTKLYFDRKKVHVFDPEDLEPFVIELTDCEPPA